VVDHVLLMGMVVLIGGRSDIDRISIGSTLLTHTSRSENSHPNDRLLPDTPYRRFWPFDAEQETFMGFRKAGTFVGALATCGFTMLIGSVGPEGFHLATLAERVGLGISTEQPAEQIFGDRLTREVWTNISGRDISEIPLAKAPDSTSLLRQFEAPTNAGDKYGQRIRGYLTAPSTGEYTFWVSGDDQAEFWLAPSADANDRIKVAWQEDWTPSQIWDWFPTQRSASIALVEGQKYYVEALMKEDVGGDGLAVGWSRPGEPVDRPSEVVPGDVLSPI
jgi:PA14 domain